MEATKSVIAAPAAARDDCDHPPHRYARAHVCASLLRETLKAWSAHRASSMGAALAFYGGTYTSPQTQGQVTPPGQPAPANPSIQNQGPGQGGSTGSMNDGSTSTMGSGPSVNPSNDPGAMSNERVARADRN